MKLTSEMIQAALKLGTAIWATDSWDRKKPESEYQAEVVELLTKYEPNPPKK